MIRSRKNEVLNLLDKKQYTTLYSDSTTDMPNIAAKDIHSLDLMTRRYNSTEKKMLGLNKDTPTFVINDTDNFEDSDLSELCGLEIGWMYYQMVEFIDNPPFDNFIIEYKTREETLERIYEMSGGAKSKLHILESRNFYIFTTAEHSDGKYPVVNNCAINSLSDGSEVLVINPCSVLLTSELEVVSNSEDGVNKAKIPLFTLLPTMGKEKLTTAEVDFFQLFFDASTLITDEFKEMDSMEVDAIADTLTKIDAVLRKIYLSSSIADMAWAVLNFSRLYNAVNVEPTVVTAPKLPPRARKKPGNKYNTHNDFIVLKPKATVTKYDRFQGDGTTNTGTPKRAHARRGHLRHLKSGKTTYVNPCYIKGGAAGQEYII